MLLKRNYIIKRHYQVLIIIIMIVMTILVSGCNVNKEQIDTIQNDENTVVLTKRQKEILKEENLPEDYNKLSLSQKNAITSIEEMLVYLENKYNTTFVYLGYVSAKGMDQEHLLACREDMSSEDVVTVYKNIKDEKVSFTDDYPNILAEPLYEARLNEYIQQYFKPDDFKIFLEINNSTGNIEKETILENASATVCIMFNETDCDANQLKKFAEDYGVWIQSQSKKSRSSSMCACIINSDKFEQLNQENYEDYLRNYRVGENIIVSISETGKINIY